MKLRSLTLFESRKGGRYWQRQVFKKLRPSCLNSISSTSVCKQPEPQDTWWKHLAEIAFHIHPEDACEIDKELVVSLCKEYQAIAEDADEQNLIEVDATKPQRKLLLQKLVNLFGDGYFKMGTLDALQLISTHGVPAFQYR